MKRLVCALGCLTQLAGCAAGPPPPKPLNPVRVLLINDLAGSDTVPDAMARLARVATVRKRIAREGPVLFVAAGNILTGRSGRAQRRVVEAFNAARLRYATFGTDELVLPPDSLVAWIAASKFTWLSTNCTVVSRSGETPLPKVRPWDTLRVSGHKVGIFGLTVAGRYANDDDRATPDIRCDNPDSAAARAIAALAAEGASLIIALTHQPTEDDRNLLIRERQLDLILGGLEGEEYKSAVGDRHLLKAGANARTAQFVTLWGGKDNWRQAVGRVTNDASLPADTAVIRAANTNPD